MDGKVLVAVFGIGAVAASAPTFAQDAMLSSAYIGGGIGQSKAKDVCANVNGAGITCDDKDTAFKLFGGMQFNRNFAAELGYTNLGKVNIGGAASGDIKTQLGELTAIGAWPVWQQLSLFGRLGGYYADAKAEGDLSGSKKTWGWTYGVGAQYDFTRSMGVRGEWQRYNKIKARDDNSGTEADSDYDVLAVNLIWRFQ